MNNQKNSKLNNMEKILQSTQKLLDDLGIDANRIEFIRMEQMAKAADPVSRAQRVRRPRPPTQPQDR